MIYRLNIYRTSFVHKIGEIKCILCPSEKDPYVTAELEARLYLNLKQIRKSFRQITYQLLDETKPTSYFVQKLELAQMHYAIASRRIEEYGGDVASILNDADYSFDERLELTCDAGLSRKSAAHLYYSLKSHQIHSTPLFHAMYHKYEATLKTLISMRAECDTKRKGFLLYERWVELLRDSAHTFSSCKARIELPKCNYSGYVIYAGVLKKIQKYTILLRK